MYLTYQDKKHRLQQIDKDTFEFRNPNLVAKHINIENNDPFLDLAANLYSITYEFNFNLDSKKRNLVYFTVGYSKEYLHLIKCCIFSIISNSKDLSNVDFLLITDSKQAFDEVAKAFPDLNLDYLIVPNAKDGIEASMNKLKVFEYEHVFKYTMNTFSNTKRFFSLMAILYSTTM